MTSRTITEIRANAAMWWPPSIKETAAHAIDLPRLLDTQAQFLSILLLAKASPFKLFDIIESSEFPANLFLKHLVILTDFGGEPLKRLGKSFTDIFPQEAGQYYFDFVWHGRDYRYKFLELPVRGLSNTKLALDAVGQGNDTILDDLTKDVIAILLFASTSNVQALAGLETCDVGRLLGNEAALNQYVKQKYLLVSRITGGAIANSLGQTLQRQVVVFLKNALGDGFTIISNGKIQLVGYDKKGGMPFDVVITRTGEQKIGLEISFQVTTNSTIERKAGQSANRQRLMHTNGHKLGYVLDGAGNFERYTAFETIIQHSDCTVAYSDSELQRLADWIAETL